jgi:hypothetical protein
MNGMSDQATQRLLHFEDCRAAIDQLFAEALNSKGLSAFDEFLDFVKRFNNLSVYNAMLVRIQRPGASAVGTRKQWGEKERRVNPDAVPIVILHPFGPVRFVYEVSDTTGPPLPGENSNVLFAVGELSGDLYEKTRLSAIKYGIEVLETDNYGNFLAGTAAGMKVCPEAIAGNGHFSFRVKVNAKHDLPTRYATLAHELGHIYCGHLGADSKGRWFDRRIMSSAQMELEAEAVAFLVCQRNGVSSRSKEYLSSLIPRTEIASVSMYAIFEAANRVESRTSPPEKLK